MSRMITFAGIINARDLGGLTTMDGKTIRKRYLPVGITADERICAGAMYARLVADHERMFSDIWSQSMLPVVR